MAYREPRSKLLFIFANRMTQYNVGILTDEILFCNHMTNNIFKYNFYAAEIPL